MYILNRYGYATIVNTLSLRVDLQEQLSDAARDQSIRVEQLVHLRFRWQVRHKATLLVPHVLVTFHGVRLAAARLAVGENGRMKSVHHLTNIMAQATLLKDAVLVVFLREHMVKVE